MQIVNQMKMNGDITDLVSEGTLPIRRHASQARQCHLRSGDEKHLSQQHIALNPL